MDRAIKLIASFFYVGYSPVAPGTAGSLGGLLVYLFVRGDAAIHALAIVVIAVLGFACAGRAEEIYSRRDEPRIVIDEVCGMLVTLFMAPAGPYAVVAGFILFRIMDIVKPYPANRVEGIGGSAGIMLDDIVAGIYANLGLQAAFRLLPRIVGALTQ